MEKKLFVVEEDDQCWVFDAAGLKNYGLESDDKITEAFGTSGRWVSVHLKKPCGGDRAEWQAKCLVDDAMLGMRFDQTREGAAKCEVFVEKWENLPGEPSVDFYNALPIPLCDAIDLLIEQHIHPTVAAHKGFFSSVSKRKLPRSGAKRTSR